MNGRNTGKRRLSTLSYGLESGFKRSLVSPLCTFILPHLFKNARWDIVQSAQFYLLQIAETVISYKFPIDFSFAL